MLTNSSRNVFFPAIILHSELLTYRSIISRLWLDITPIKMFGCAKHLATLGQMPIHMQAVGNSSYTRIQLEMYE